MTSSFLVNFNEDYLSLVTDYELFSETIYPVIISYIEYHDNSQFKVSISFRIEPNFVETLYGLLFT